MTLFEIKIEIEADLAAAEQHIKDKWAEIVAFVEGKQADDAAKAQAEADRVAAEVADLIAKGYTVTAPETPAIVA